MAKKNIINKMSNNNETVGKLAEITTSLLFISKNQETMNLEIRQMKNELKSDFQNLKREFVSQEEFKPVKTTVENMQTQIQKLNDEVKKYVAYMTIIVAITVPIIQMIITNFFGK